MTYPLFARRARRRGPVYGGGAGFTPLSLFESGEEGAWYDPSDLSTLFQDSAGTTPVTVDGDPGGLMLDKSQGLVLGPELVTNGTFDTDTGWTKGTGWSISGGVATYNGVGGNDLTQSFTLDADKFYKVTLNITSYNSGSVRLRWGGFTGPFLSGTGSKTVIGVSTSGSSTFMLDPAAFDGSIDNVSVKALPGFHATQSTSSFRPVVDEPPTFFINFDGVDDFHRTVFPDLGTDVTIAHAVPGVGASILTGQTIGAGNYDYSTDHAGLVIVDRALTAAETTSLTAYLNAKAGV